VQKSLIDPKWTRGRQRGQTQRKDTDAGHDAEDKEGEEGKCDHGGSLFECEECYKELRGAAISDGN